MLAKAALFLGIALLSSGLIVAEMPNSRIVILLLLALWAACRLYYFLFYVIERYIDPSFKFSGVGRALAYLVRSRGKVAKSIRAEDFSGRKLC